MSDRHRHERRCSNGDWRGKGTGGWYRTFELGVGWLVALSGKDRLAMLLTNRALKKAGFRWQPNVSTPRRDDRPTEYTQIALPSVLMTKYCVKRLVYPNEPSSSRQTTVSILLHANERKDATTAITTWSVRIDDVFSATYSSTNAVQIQHASP